MPITPGTSETVDPVPVKGGVINNNTLIGFDDRKRVVDWIVAQGRYVTREYSYIHAHEPLRLTDALRLRPPLMPVLTFLYCLFVKGLILDGRAGLFYSLQRLLVETAIALKALEHDLKPNENVPPRKS